MNATGFVAKAFTPRGAACLMRGDDPGQTRERNDQGPGKERQGLPT